MYKKLPSLKRKTLVQSLMSLGPREILELQWSFAILGMVVVATLLITNEVCGTKLVKILK